MGRLRVQAGRARWWLETLRPASRARAVALLPFDERGAVTVVTVAWNSRHLLAETLPAIKARSTSRPTRIMVMDNASSDGTADWLPTAHPDVQLVSMPANVGHGRAMDLGWMLARTEYVIGLDVDAFPLTDDWIEASIAPLRGDVTVVGSHLAAGDTYLGRDYVHATWLTMRRSRFVLGGHTWREWDGLWDTAQRITDAELRRGRRVHYIDPTETRGPSVVGTVFGGRVYHNFYSTRFGGTDAPTLDQGVARDDPVQAWSEAVNRWLR